jgi:hypothetical protein
MAVTEQEMLEDLAYTESEGPADMGDDDWDRLGEEDDFDGLEGEDEFATEDYGEDMFAKDSLEAEEAEEAEESVASQLGAMLGAEDEDEFFGKLLGGIKSLAKKAAPFVGKLARGAGPILSMIPHPDLGVGDQVVEEVGAADGVDVLVPLRAEFVLDLAPDVVTLLLDHAGCRAGVVEVEVGLAVRRHPELGEQVVDHRRAVGIQDLALDGADPEMLQRGVHLGCHLGHALIHHRLHALQHALGAKRAHVLHLVGEDGVLERDVRHHQRAGRDLRATVVDGEIFTAAFRSEPRYRVDYRAGIASAEVTSYRLPGDVADRLRELMARLGLIFGAVDFRVTPEGEHVFFEVNPAGEYLFVVDRTTLPIPQAIAAALERHAAAH